MAEFHEKLKTTNGVIHIASRVNPRWRHPWEVIRAKTLFAIDIEPCMTELVAQKEEMSRLKNKKSIESDHVQNSQVVNVLFSVLTMIRN